MTRTVRTALAAVLIVVGGWFVGTSPATAAACTKGSGVTVVVNGGVSCVSGSGGNAATKFGQAGHSLRYASRQPGFVCQVNGAPSSDPCVNASPSSAYWGLFWSNGNGSWTYSNTGVTTLNVPTGGWVAFVFQNGGATDYPSMTPSGPAAAAKPQPTRAPTSAKPVPTASASAAEKEESDEKAASEEDAAAKDGGDEQSDSAAAPSAESSARAGAAETSSEPIRSTSQDTAAATKSLFWFGMALALFLVLGIGLAIVQRRRMSE